MATEEHQFSVRAFWVIVIMNALLLGATYMVAGDVLRVQEQMIGYLVIWAVITVSLWLLVRFYGGRMARAVEQRLPADQLAEAAVTAGAAKEQAPAPVPVTQPSPAPEPQVPHEAAAIQMLAILQRQGRLIDFLQEDLNQFDDAQIGAAVRNVHSGCKSAIEEHVDLAPIYTEAEGSRVEVQPGFDAYAVRLTGAVSGEPPFYGTLQHRGWRVNQITLPSQASAQASAQVIAPAEVEVEER